MGNYLYDDYEAKMKVTNDIINDWNFFTKLKQNFVSPFKIFTFIQIIFISNKSPPFHIKFLQIFYNNLNILERDENFGIVIELHKDLLNKLSFHEAYNNFNVKLCDIKSKIPDRSIYNYGLVKPKKIALEHFFLYVNFHRNEFEKLKYQIKQLVKEIKTFPEKIDTNEDIKKIEYEENENILVTYIGNLNDNIMEGKGILTKKKKTTGETIFEYIGEFKNNMKNGLGIMKKNGVQIEGQFLNDEFDGKIGIYSEDGLEIFEMKNGEENGRKIFFDKKGNISTSVVNGNVTSNFSFYFKDTEEFFTGKQNELKLFEGLIYGRKEGDIRVGKFNSNYQLTGEGYQYINYNGFYGTFENGRIMPSLFYDIEDSGHLYSGLCTYDGVFHGTVIWLMYSNDPYKGDLFVGNYVNGERKGYGEYYWGNGSYEKQIYPEGYGERFFKGEVEKIMEGYLIRGFARGRGFFTYDGTKYSGEYLLNDERCLFLSDDGKKAIKYNIVDTPRFNEATVKQFKVEANN